MPSSFRTVLIALGFVAITSAVSVAQLPGDQKEYLVLENNVTIRAKADRSYAGPPFELVLSISYNDDKYTLTTSLIAVENLGDALEEQKQLTGWKGRYLFVRTSCGGGSAWDCHLEEIFALRNGRLIHVGNTIVSHDGELGSSFLDGYFVDIYDKLEMNDLTGHAGAPEIVLILQENNGHFCADIQRTWERNISVFEENQLLIRSAISSKSEMPEVERNRTIEALLFNTTLARYCNKSDQVEALFRADEKVLNKEQCQVFFETISEVVAGEIPRHELSSLQAIVTN